MMIRHILTVLAFLLFIPSQIFWLWQVRGLLQKFVRSLTLRRWLGRLGTGAYLVLLAFNLLWPRSVPEPARLTLQAALLQAPFRWWTLASLIGFVAIAAFYVCSRLGRAAYWVYRKALPASPRSARPYSPGTPALSCPDGGGCQRHTLRRLRLWDALRAHGD